MDGSMPVYVCIIKAVHWISYLRQDKVSPVHGSSGLASLHCIGVGIGSVEEFSRGLGPRSEGRQALDTTVPIGGSIVLSTEQVSSWAFTCTIAERISHLGGKRREGKGLYKSSHSKRRQTEGAVEQLLARFK